MKTKRSLSSAGVILLFCFFSSAHGMAQASTSILHSFPVIDGQDPRDGLTLSPDGPALYGTTYGGGAYNLGTVFKIDTGGGPSTVLHSFGGSDGKNPCGGLTLSPDGHTLYGTTFGGGASDGNGYGVVFSYDIGTGAYAVLHAFPGFMGDGMGPQGGLVLSGDGTTLYGTTASGGNYNNAYYGAVFSLNISAKTCSILCSFDNFAGYYPQCRLVLSPDGTTLYGTTQNSWDGSGTVFKIGTAGGTPTCLHNFQDSDGAFPQGLTLSSDGATLYGVTNPGQGGWPGNGTIFQMNTDGGSFTVLHTFGGSDGKYPQGSLTLSGDTLYGMTTKGGANDGGTAFKLKMETSGVTLTVLHSFDSVDDGGVFPFSTGGLVLSGANLYGMRRLGGVLNKGSVFQTNTSGTAFTTLHFFAEATDEGQNPYGSLTLSGDGATLYGMTTQGGVYNRGAIFKMDTGGAALAILHSFGDPGVTNDGQYSFGSLTLSGSTLYGMTPLGGANGVGAIFSYNTSTPAYAILRSFGGVTGDGGYPNGSLTLSKDGATLYGMTQLGGANGYGAIFSYNVTTTAYAILHSFGDATGDGRSPYGDLTLGSDGSTLYGMTQTGGANGRGAIFSYDLSTPAYAILHSFGDASNDGGFPYGNLTLSTDGATLYGMTYSGGARGGGIVFSYNLGTTAYTILHAFPDGASDGYFPLGSLALSGSTLYGMANGAGSFGRGTVFQMGTGGGALTVLHAFGDPGVTDDGQYPRGNLTLGGDGATFYGMTNRGGANGTGAVFALTFPAVIDLVSFTATPSPSAVTLAWQTGAEIDTVGFYLSRSLAREGPFTRITALIPAQGFSAQGAAYRYADTDVQGGTTYYYTLEDIDDNGTATRHGPASATVTAPPDAGEFFWRPLRQAGDNGPPDSPPYTYCIF